MQSHLPELDLLVPRSPTVLLEFVGCLGMNARLSKMSRDLPGVAVIGNGVLPIVDLLLPSHQDALISLQVGWHGRRRLPRVRTEKDGICNMTRLTVKTTMQQIMVHLPPGFQTTVTPQQCKVSYIWEFSAPDSTSHQEEPMASKCCQDNRASHQLFRGGFQVYGTGKHSHSTYLPDDAFLSLPKSFMRSFLLYLGAK